LRGMHPSILDELRRWTNASTVQADTPMTQFAKIAELTEDEVAACTEYYRDATLLHAAALGWINMVDDSEVLRAFHLRCGTLVRQLDQAIEKFRLYEDTTVYSGHGRGLSVVGALRGDAEQFRGLQYCYSGFTSTSLDRGVAENFLRTRSSGSQFPTLLEFRLRARENILPISEVTGQGSVVVTGTFSGVVLGRK
jgi:hypothetical protein